MPTMVCQRCSRREVWGLMSSQAWLEHRNGDGTKSYVCPDCKGTLDADQRQRFLKRGSFEIGA